MSPSHRAYYCAGIQELLNLNFGQATDVQTWACSGFPQSVQTNTKTLSFQILAYWQLMLFTSDSVLHNLWSWNRYV